MTRPRAPSKKIIPPDLLLEAYASGVFPMAESADDPSVFWVEPERRGVFPLDGLIVPRRLARTVRQDKYRVTADTDFAGVIDLCAARAADRPNTWINPIIRDSYLTLYERGHAHSVEVYNGAALVGGLYGVSLGGAFFGESMVSRARDASKVALIHLAARLIAGGYRLLDTQFVTEHLASLGAVEVGRAHYKRMLTDAVTHRGTWRAMEPSIGGAEALALLSGG